MWVTMTADESNNSGSLPLGHHQLLRFAQYIQLANATSIPIPRRPVNINEEGFEDISQQDWYTP
jgi:hypothetical protein